MMKKEYKYPITQIALVETGMLCFADPSEAPEPTGAPARIGTSAAPNVPINIMYI